MTSLLVATDLLHDLTELSDCLAPDLPRDLTELSDCLATDLLNDLTDLSGCLDSGYRYYLPFKRSNRAK